MRKPILLIYLGEHVRKMREEYGITQKELAERIGTNQPNISRIESGEAEYLPSIRTLNLLADACGHKLVIKFKKKSGWHPPQKGKRRKTYKRPYKLI